MKRLHCFRVNAVNGQSLAEYGLVLALVAVVAIGSLNALGASLQGILSGLTAQMGVHSTSSPAVAIAGAGVGAGGNTSTIPSGSTGSPAIATASTSTTTVNTAGGGCNGCAKK